MKLQRLGGYAAIAFVCVTLIGLAFMFRLQRLGDLNDPIQAMTVISSSPVDFYFAYLLRLPLSILILITVLAINERMLADAPNLTRMATIAASITAALGILQTVTQVFTIEQIVPTNDVSAYGALDTIAKSMWAASGHTSGWISLLIGCAILKTRKFQKTPACLLILTGIFWIRLPIPLELGRLAIIPSISWCVSFLWLGIAMLRQTQQKPLSKGIGVSG